MPFNIPDNWTWARIGNYAIKITDYVASGSFKALHDNVKYYKNPNYAILVKTQDFQSCFTKNLTYTDLHGYQFLENSNLFGGELILSNVGSIGKCFIVPHLKTPMTLAPNSIMVRLKGESLKDWIFALFQSNFGLTALLSISSATAIKKFNKTDFKKIIIPIPPLNEQNRILIKLQKIEQNIKQYAILEANLTNLESCFESRLKTSILQYAIEGKLVKQDPNDEPAQKLLERINEEKEKLIKEGKIKRKKYDSEVTFGDDKDYYAFDLPSSWKIVRLGCLFLHNTGKALNQKNRKGILKEYITTSNVYWDCFVLKNLKKMYFKESELDKCSTHKGDLLVCEGGDIGRSAIWREPYSICIQNHIHRLRAFLPEICSDFYLNVFKVYKITGMIGGKGIGIQGLSSNALDSLLLPLPPFEEQKRIALKLSALNQMI